MLLRSLTLALSAVVLIGSIALGQLPAGAGRTQVRFAGPSGMKVSWYIRTPDGKDSYSKPALEVPGRYNFRQGAAYRLNLTDIPGHPGLEVFPTLEVVSADGAAQEFLAHSAVAVTFTDEDFRQVQAGNFVVKVVYLSGQEGAGPVTLVGTGTNPRGTAQQLGSVLLVIRLGNRT